MVGHVARRHSPHQVGYMNGDRTNSLESHTSSDRKKYVAFDWNDELSLLAISNLG